MRLKEVGIKNFRGYRNETRMPIDPNVTGITGKNDAGKSSLLEALDIFFEGGEIALEKDDFNVNEPDGMVEIRCIFDNLPSEIVLDETNRTTLQTEHLLNSAGDLEILKRYKRSALKDPSIFLIANHPTATAFDDLHTLKITDLKKRAREKGVADSEVADGRASASWRLAIWGKAPDLQREPRELEISKFAGDSKTIQDKLFKQLPLFALFKSDRESKDNDPQAKNPLQEAVKQAQAELKAQIETIQVEIQNRVLERAQKTLEKLREMDPSLASQLVPRFKKAPSWTFEFALDGEDGIPINKRGSGVRRLILLNFFRAESERKVADKNAPSVIYAFEEPETSQHPSNQEMLVRALVQVGAKDNCQALVTTHVPALAGLLPVSGLRLAEKTPSGTTIEYGSDTVIDRIAQSLGVLIDPRASRAKGLLLVEGPSDVVFLRHTAEQLKAGGYISATLEERGLLPVSIGGCDLLKHWIAKRIAEQFNIPWALLLDSDSGTPENGKNLAQVQALKQLGKKAYVTRKREPENYILPEVVLPHITCGVTVTWTDTSDAKKDIGSATSKSQGEVLEFFWTQMNAEQIRRAEKYIEDGQEKFELTEILSDFLTLS
ncbi:MAG TPA: AAA family ATPase [Nitrospira sp.]|nr:AAA family ATPase [Nitrospira sp.]